jgi:hypothetical protein
MARAASRENPSEADGREFSCSVVVVHGTSFDACLRRDDGPSEPATRSPRNWGASDAEHPDRDASATGTTHVVRGHRRDDGQQNLALATAPVRRWAKCGCLESPLSWHSYLSSIHTYMVNMNN